MEAHRFVCGKSSNIPSPECSSAVPSLVPSNVKMPVVCSPPSVGGSANSPATLIPAGLSEQTPTGTSAAAAAAEHSTKAEVLQICAMVTALRQAFKDPSVLCAATAFALYRDHPSWEVRLIAPASYPKLPGRPQPRMILRNVLTIFTETRSHILIDFEWREHFNVQLQTKTFAEFYKTLSAVFVGTLSTLTRHLKHHGSQVEACFRAFGISIPPWRTSNSMVQSFQFHVERAISVDTFCETLLSRHNSTVNPNAPNRASSKSCISPPVCVSVAIPATQSGCSDGGGVNSTPKGYNRVQFVLPPPSPHLDDTVGPLAEDPPYAGGSNGGMLKIADRRSTPHNSTIALTDSFPNGGDPIDGEYFVDEDPAVTATEENATEGDEEAKQAKLTGRKCTSILSRLLAERQTNDIFSEAARAYATADTRPCPIPPPPGIDVYAAGSEVAQPFPENPFDPSSVYSLPSSILASYQDPPLAWPILGFRGAGAGPAVYGVGPGVRALSPVPIPPRPSQQPQRGATDNGESLSAAGQSPVRSSGSTEKCLGDNCPPTLQFDIMSSQPPPCLTPDMPALGGTQSTTSSLLDDGQNLLPPSSSSLTDTTQMPPMQPHTHTASVSHPPQPQSTGHYAVDPWSAATIPPSAPVSAPLSASAEQAVPIMWGYVGKTPIEGPVLPNDFLSTLSAHWAPCNANAYASVSSPTTTTSATAIPIKSSLRAGKATGAKEDEDSFLFEKVSPVKISPSGGSASQPQASLLSQLLSSETV